MLTEGAISLLMQTGVQNAGTAQAKLPDHVTALPAGDGAFRLTDLEPYLPGRVRFRGKLETTSLPDFVAYVKANTGLELRVKRADGFIDADTHSAKVYFNLIGMDGQPGHADHTATLKLKPTAAYTAVMGVDGKRQTQRGLIDFLEDWGRNVSRIYDEEGNPLTLAQAISAIRTLKVLSKKDSEHHEGERRATRSTLEEAEVQSKGAAVDRLFFTCAPFIGLPERTLELRVAALTSHEEPQLILRIVSKEEGIEAVAQDFKAKLTADLEGAATLTVGTFAA